MNTVTKLILMIVAALSLTLFAAFKQVSVKEKEREEVDIVPYTQEIHSVYYAVDLDGTEDVGYPAGSYVMLRVHETNTVTGLIPINCPAAQLLTIADIPFFLVTYEKYQQRIVSTTLLCIASE